jgi:hypothetical protein
VGKIAQLLAIIIPVPGNFAHPTLIANIEQPTPYADTVMGFLARRAT